jgi:nucleoid-associated protein YgaU
MASLFRYASDNQSRGGLSTSTAVNNIRLHIANGNIGTRNYVMKEGDRLDLIAHDQYGDGRLWWVIAAASNIGWWAQLPAGTLLRIPINLSEVGSVIQ